MALFLFSMHEFVKGHSQQHGTKGKSLALDSSCVHLGPQQSLRVWLPTGTKGTHIQSNVKHRGGRENQSQKKGGEDKTCFICCALGSGTIERVQLDTMILVSTTHIPQWSLQEKMPNNSSTLLPSICNVSFSSVASMKQDFTSRKAVNFSRLGS